MYYFFSSLLPHSSCIHRQHFFTSDPLFSDIFRKQTITKYTLDIYIIVVHVRIVIKYRINDGIARWIFDQNLLIFFAVFGFFIVALALFFVLHWLKSLLTLFYFSTTSSFPSLLCYFQGRPCKGCWWWHSLSFVFLFDYLGLHFAFRCMME